MAPLVARLALALATLNSATPAIGQNSATFHLHLSTDRVTYSSGEPIVLTVDLQNADAAGAGHSVQSGFGLVVKSGVTTVRSRRGTVIVPGSSNVRAGGAVTMSVPLDNWSYFLPPGTYDILVDTPFEQHQPLQSNVVRIVVTSIPWHPGTSDSVCPDATSQHPVAQSNSREDDHDFALRLTMQRTTYRQSELIDVLLTVRNVSCRPAFIGLYNYPAYDYTVSVSSHGQAVQTTLPFVPAVFSRGGVELGPGETYSEIAPTAAWRYELHPGTYDLVGSRRGPDAGVPLSSNTVEIVVTP